MTRTQQQMKQDVRAATARRLKLSFVVERFKHDPSWPWISGVGPLAECDWTPVRIKSVWDRFPKLTRFHAQWQYAKAMRAIRDTDAVFLFGPEITIGLTSAMAKLGRQPKRICMGFTQDGPFPQRWIEKLSKALRRCDAITMFTEEEKDVYVSRYGLDASKVRVIPIHTDHDGDYEQYPVEETEEIRSLGGTKGFALALGSPNRRFLPTAKACQTLGVPLVIITRPWHKNDSLDELRSLGAKVITDADQMRSLTALRHARLAIMPFDDPGIAGGYTTLMHAMFMKTPFVATKALGVSEHVIDGETGFVTPHGDDAALQAAIGRLWNENGLSERFGEASRALAIKRHTVTAASEAFHRLAHDVVDGSFGGS